MGGMGGMPFGGGGKKSKGRSGKAPVKGKKSRSGNPAKRAVQESESATQLPSADGDLAAPDPASFDPASFELPDDVKKLLGP